MPMKNNYIIHSHISEKKFRDIIYLFSEDLSATQISHLTKISRPSINKYLTAFRLRIIDYCQDQSPLNEERKYPYRRAREAFPQQLRALLV